MLILVTLFPLLGAPIIIYPVFTKQTANLHDKAFIVRKIEVALCRNLINPVEGLFN